MSSRAAGNPIVPELDITGEASETGWILAEIEGSIGGDKNRCVDDAVPGIRLIGEVKWCDY